MAAAGGDAGARVDLGERWDLKARREEFRALVDSRLRSEGAARASWNRQTQIPTLAHVGLVKDYARRVGLALGEWLYDDRREAELEQCDGNWRPVMGELAASAQQAVSSIQSSAAAFRLHVRVMERSHKTRSKYHTHRLSVLTWAIWRGPDRLQGLLPMSERDLEAFLWDALTFQATLPVLQNAVNAILAWHRNVGLRPPLSEHGAYSRLMHCLARFQGSPRRLVLPISARLVRTLLERSYDDLHRLAGVAPCPGDDRLGRWRDRLAAAFATIICARCSEVAQLQSCDLWLGFDQDWDQRLRGAAAVNIKVRKNDQLRKGHYPRVGVSADPAHDVVRHLVSFMRVAGTTPRGGCQKRRFPQARCPLCPPLFPRSRRGTLDLTRPPDPGEISKMIVRGLRTVGADSVAYSGISARKGGLSTAIEANVPEHVLWMQSGHAQDKAARRYVQLGSPALLYDTWRAFRL